MIRQICTMTLMTAALALPPLARADEMNEPLRCEALAMRKEGQRFDCLGRCDRQNGRRAERLGDEAGSTLTDCQQACEDRFANAMEAIDERNVCHGTTPTPDPNRCQARLLRAGSSRLICQSACSAQANSREAFDATDCVAGCNQRYSATVDRIMAKDFCLNQKAPTD